MKNAQTLIVQAMQNDIQRLDIISHNLANANTGGYRRQVSMLHTFDVALKGAQKSVLDIRNAPTFGTYTEHRSGSMILTKRPLDMAIVDDDVYFTVQTEKGVNYSRNGSFHVDGQGRLVNVDNQPVIGMQGIISVGDADISIDSKGEIRSGERLFDQLRLVRVPKDIPLNAQGSSLYMTMQVDSAFEEVRPELKIGYLEGSNVVAMKEMTQLMETIRHFEACQRVSQGYGDAIGQAIQKIGQF